MSPPLSGCRKMPVTRRIATTTCATGFYNAIRVLIPRREPYPLPVAKPTGFTTVALTALACKIAPICLIPYLGNSSSSSYRSIPAPIQQAPTRNLLAYKFARFWALPSAGKQPCRGIARRAHRDDDRGRGSHLSRSTQNPIGSKDPDTLKIPARRAASTLARNAPSPVPAEPAHYQVGTLPELLGRQN